MDLRTGPLGPFGVWRNNCPLKSQPTTYWQGSHHHLSRWTRQYFPIILANERLIWAIWFCNTLLHHCLKAAEHIFSYVLSIKYCSWGCRLVRFAAHKAKMERLVVARARRGPWGQLLSVFLLMLCAPFFSGQVLCTDALKYFFKVEPKCVQTFPGHSALSVLLILLCLMRVKNQCLAFPTARCRVCTHLLRLIKK